MGPLPVLAGPTPLPTPTPTPSGTPSPEPTPSPGGSAVVRLAVHVNFVVCNNEGVPDSGDATRVLVDCKVRMDVNAKDADNKLVEPVGRIGWSYSDSSLIAVLDDDPWGPLLLAKRPGRLEITAAVDGVRSEPYRIEFYLD